MPLFVLHVYTYKYTYNIHKYKHTHIYLYVYMYETSMEEYSNQVVCEWRVKMTYFTLYNLFTLLEVCIIYIITYSKN